MKKILETERLCLREMEENDLQALYSVLGDTDIMRHYPYTFDETRVTGWIKRNLERYAKNGFGLWAVCLKDSGEMIGDCGLTLQNINGRQLPEIGYHIRRDCQKKGYAKEAAAAVRDWAFLNTGYPALYSYCKYTNIPSFRTAEAVGMRFCEQYPDKDNGITHVSRITREEWALLCEKKENGNTDTVWKAMFLAAEAVRNERKVSDYIEAGGVSAAVLSASGRIYTGVCVDTCSTLGICAERNAIFNMLTNGENMIARVLAVMPDGKCGAPCGACRELMVQLMPGAYQNIQIMMDMDTGRIKTLGELTPEWWIK